MKEGFTLIELLVVVLIIGILAAIALPQYQKAVYKARYSTMMDLVNAIANAEELYYLANDTYTTDPASLDITFPADFSISQFDRWYTPDWEKVIWMDTAADTTGRFIGSQIELASGFSVVYGVYLNHSENGRRRQCRSISNQEKGKKFCLSMGGIDTGETLGGTYVFNLP